MVKSNKFKPVIFNYKLTRESTNKLIFYSVLKNKFLSNTARALIYAYSRPYFKFYSTKFKSSCLITGRNRGVLSKFYMSRIVFKKFSISGSINGFKKSRW